MTEPNVQRVLRTSVHNYTVAFVRAALLVFLLAAPASAQSNHSDAPTCSAPVAEWAQACSEHLRAHFCDGSVIVFEAEVEGRWIRLDLREETSTVQIVGDQADVAAYPPAAAQHIAALETCAAHHSPFSITNRQTKQASTELASTELASTELASTELAMGRLLPLSFVIACLLLITLLVRATRGGRVGFGILAALGGTILALVCAEGLVRIANLSLPVQRVAQSPYIMLVGDGPGLHWTSRNTGRRTLADRRYYGCPDQESRPRVVLQGSSILWGSGVAAEDAFGARMREAFQARGFSSVCVVNHAQAGSTYRTQHAALAAAEGAPAQILLWELWHNSENTFTRLGDTAYNFGNLELRPDGIPDPFGLGPLTRPLLTHSRLYQWLSLHRTPKDRSTGLVAAEKRRTFVGEFVAGTKAEAERRGAQLVVASFPSLDKPFEDQFANNDRIYGSVLSALRDAGVPVIEMDRALIAHTPESIGVDTCCHYNPAGVKIVSEILAAALMPLLLED